MLASSVKGYVASDIEYIINNASHTAAVKEVPISMDLILDLMKEFKPTLNEENRKEYDKHINAFENNDKSDNNSRTPIGFRRN